MSKSDQEIVKTVTPMYPYHVDTRISETPYLINMIYVFLKNSLYLTWSMFCLLCNSSSFHQGQ